MKTETKKKKRAERRPGGGREEAGVRGRNGRVTAQVEGWTIKSQHQQLHRSLAVSDDVDLSSGRGDGSASLSHSIASARAHEWISRRFRISRREIKSARAEENLARAEDARNETADAF